MTGKFLKAKITTRAVEALKPDETIADTELPGYFVRRQKGEARTYFVRKHVRGQRQFATIGEHGREGWTEHKARAEALMIIAALRKGDDLRAERAKRRGMPTVAEYAASYLETQCASLKTGTVDNYRGLLRTHIAPADRNDTIGKLKLDKVTKAQIAEVHRRLKPTPRAANHVVQFLSVVFQGAQEDGLLPLGHNPAKKIKLYTIEPRTRFLTDAEMARVGEVFADFESTGGQSPFAIAAIRLLMFTGCRKNEIARMRWDWLDFDRGILNLPHAKRGSRSVLLSPIASQVLKSLPRIAGNPYVIVGDNEGQHYKSLQGFWKRVREKASLEPTTLRDGRKQHVRIHDLRHGFAAMVASQGASLLTIGKLLGHRNPTSTALYAHLADDPLRRVSADAGQIAADAMSPKLLGATTDDIEFTGRA